MNSPWWKRCWMRCKTPASFHASHRAEPERSEKISISPRKRGDWKKFIFERLVAVIDLNPPAGGSDEPLLPLIFTVCLLFFCPGLRHVLNAWSTDVLNQYKR